MPSKPMEILHTLMTNQMFIFAVAIVLFLLVITLADPGESQAVIAGMVDLAHSGHFPGSANRRQA